jgi:hypothetical protein
MKRTIITLSIVLFALVLAIVFGTPKAHTFNSSAAIAAPAPLPMAVPVPGRCPNIHEAIRALRLAHDNDLNPAGHDFCGHKRDAMLAIDEAMKQLRLAEECARCRE